jgi:RHS repeat-associated protein
MGVMSGISSKAAGGIQNRKKYNGIEFNNDLDINTYEANYRNLDPQTGKWWQIDPKIESMEMWSPYVSNYDNPIRYSDPLGDQPGPDDPPGWRFPMALPANYNYSAPSIYLGIASIKAGNLRVAYNKATAPYKGRSDVAAKTARTELKEQFREKTPEPFKTAIETTRPIKGEWEKSNNPEYKGDAGKTNLKVNEIMGTTKAIGTGIVVLGIAQSSYTIATSPTPVKETITEGAGWAGAAYGGSAGATAWSVAGPWGAAAGAVVGSTIGFFVGKNGSDAVLNMQPAISAGAKDFYDYNERARQGVLDQNGWPLPIVCFTKGTLIYGKYEFIEIENIKVGDSIYSYNIEKDKDELSRVINTLKRETLNIYEITAGNEIINVTAEHPIYVSGKGFTKVKDLQVGDVLKSFDCKMEVQVSKIKNLSKTVTVYNIEVDGNHDYFVTKSKILVHNKDISKLKK